MDFIKTFFLPFFLASSYFLFSFLTKQRKVIPFFSFHPSSIKPNKALRIKILVHLRNVYSRNNVGQADTQSFGQKRQEAWLTNKSDKIKNTEKWKEFEGIIRRICLFQRTHKCTTQNHKAGYFSLFTFLTPFIMWMACGFALKVILIGFEPT